jgi:xylulokinase
MQESVLTIDLGTTACKAILFSDSRDVIHSVSVPYSRWHHNFECAEQNPEDWWAVVTTAVRRLVREAERTQVKMIALSSQRETIVPVDHRMRPVHSAILWMDMRGIPDIIELAECFGADLQRWTGLVPSSTYSMGKVLWLRRAHPELACQVRYYLQPKDYLLYRMSGVLATDFTLASRSMLFNIHTRRWQPELLDACQITEDQLPPVHASDTVVASLAHKVAEEWGLPPGIPILLGGGDRPCEVLGSGVQYGEVMESSGTTSNVSCLVHQPPCGETPVSCSLHVIDGEWLLEQGMSASGAIFDWLRALFGETDGPDLNRVLERTTAGASGLLLLPFFMGARAPRWNPSASGAILGLTLSHRGEEIYRALMEGIAYEMRTALALFERLGVRIEAVRLVGGGAGSGRWNRIKASIYRRRLVQPRVIHAASFGLFLLAARKLGWLDSHGDGHSLNPARAIYDPDDDLAELYDYGYSLYGEWIERTEPLWPRLEQYKRLVEQLHVQ